MPVEITEFEELSPDEVHLVKRGANGFPALIAKAAAEEVVAAEAGEDLAAETAKGIANVPGSLVAMQDGTLVVGDEPVTVKACTTCQGSGIDVDDESKSCPSCGGKGLDEPIGPIPATKAADEKCATCKGDGKIKDGNVDCPDCGGSGKQSDADAAKATVSAADQNDLPDSDFAYIESGGKKDADGKTIPRSLRHFPIMDAAHVRNALARAPQSPFGPKAMPAILAAAKKFDIDTSAEKAADDLSTPDPLDTPDEADIQTPGSAGWEAQDAANLIAAGQALAVAQQIVAVAQQREQTEVSVGLAEDMTDVADLGDALYAIQAALGIVARVAFQEEAESNSAGATKAGKVLSAKNVTGVKAAIQALQDLLTSAGETDNDGEDAAKSQEDILAMTKDELIALLDERDAAKAVAPTEPASAADEAVETEPDDAAAKATASSDPAAVEAAVEKAMGGAVEAVTEAVIKSVMEMLAKTPQTGGPAKTRTPDAIRKSELRDATDIAVADLERRADVCRDDPEARKGYLDRAKALRAQKNETAAA